MGMVLGKVSEELPAYRILRKTDDYQIWRYPAQVAAVVYARDMPTAENGEFLRDNEFTSKAFPTLARYIGVFGEAQNRAAGAAAGGGDAGDAEKVAMTAPVVMTPAASEKIAMTAPVVMTPAAADASSAPASDADGSAAAEKVAMTAPVVMSPEREPGAQCMKFLLPAKYKSVADAPVPTDPAVKIEMVDAGRCHAVVQFSGNFDMARCTRMANELLAALKRDGVTVVGDWEAMGYNPPFTLPWLKRNEVHVPIDPAPYEGEEGTLHTEDK